MVKKSKSKKLSEEAEAFKHLVKDDYSHSYSYTPEQREAFERGFDFAFFCIRNGITDQAKLMSFIHGHGAG